MGGGKECDTVSVFTKLYTSSGSIQWMSFHWLEAKIFDFVSLDEFVYW